MTVISDARSAGSPILRRRTLSPPMARTALAAGVLVAGLAGAWATGPDAAAAAVHDAGADLTRLLRLMAAIKAAMAAGAVAAVVWRLGVAVSAARLALYGLACGASAAGPGLIWGMAHVGLGALLLHGGLIACVLLLWFDPAVAGRLQALLAVRRRMAQHRHRRR